MTKTKKRASADPSSQKPTKILKELRDDVDVDSISMDDLVFTLTPDTPKEEYMLIRDYTEEFLRQNRECAETALEFYNKKHNTNYELVEAMASNAFMHGMHWLHCNFKAKKHSADGDSCTKTFFAELCHHSSQPLMVKHCRILKGKTVRCMYCRYDCKQSNIIEHPVNGFDEGHYPYRGGNCKYDLRSRSSSN